MLDTDEAGMGMEAEAEAEVGIGRGTAPAGIRGVDVGEILVVGLGRAWLLT